MQGRIEKETLDMTETKSSLDTSLAPDGGWGWFVVFGSFMIHIIADGITYTQGIYVVDLKKQLNEGSAAVSWISSILVGVTLGSGKAYFFLTYLTGL